jgi:tripartite-type tricarboxylate transporter receptor subunit TctC
LATAQDYPTRAVRLIVGASPEATPRLIADSLHKQFGQPFVVEPRGGAGGDIAAKAVATAEPDGHTLLYASSNYTLATAMQLGSFDFAKDFLPIALVGTSAYALVVHPSVDAKTVPELIALAKAKPGELNCGSSGIATPGHLACEMFKAMAGVKIVHVPFREANSLMNGLVSGQVQLSFAVSTAARSQIQAGTVRGLAVTTATPSPLLPELQPIESFGLSGFVLNGWGSFMAPVGTPRPAIEKLNAGVVRAVQDPEIAEKLRNFGLQPAPAWNPEQFGDYVRSEIARWNRTIDMAGVQRGKPQSN